jgi:hypothetical protein
MPASVPPSYTRHARPSTNMPPQTKSVPRGALVFRGCVVVYARARARPTKRLPRLSSQSELPTFSPFSVASSLASLPSEDTQVCSRRRVPVSSVLIVELRCTLMMHRAS